MVSLKPMTRQMCHEFYKNFQNDPAIGHYYEYVYNPEIADRYFDNNSAADHANEQAQQDEFAQIARIFPCGVHGTSVRAFSLFVNKREGIAFYSRQPYTGPIENKGERT